MPLFLLETREPNGWDTADGFVVAAKDEKTARQLAAKQAGDEGAKTWLDSTLSSCELLSKSNQRKFDGVILRSFNAG